MEYYNDSHIPSQAGLGWAWLQAPHDCVDVEGRPSFVVLPMTHDNDAPLPDHNVLRHNSTYMNLVASDPKEHALRVRWYETMRRKEAGEEGASTEHERVNDELARYLWDRCRGDIERDRAKHPKAKRNQVYDGPKGDGRVLP